MLSLARTITSLALRGRRLYSAASNIVPPPEVTGGEQNIRNKLVARFSPLTLDIKDVSGGCGSFYAINITSSVFEGLSTIKQHKLVTETLKQEIEGIHGLQIKTASK